MDWAEYAVAFRVAAARKGKSEQYVDQCLAYGMRLHHAGLPIIYDAAHFSALVGYDIVYVMACCYAQEKAYRRFRITKKAGGEREIAEPLPSLKEIQRWVLDNVLYRLPVSRYAKGFVPGRSIAENARFHQHQPLVLSLDIQDFFPSFKRRKVNRLFLSLGYSRSVAGTLAYLCTLDGVLPQGAPTSPAISNLLFVEADRRIAAYALKLDCRYTRYADDITISGTVQVGPTVRFVRRVLAEYGLRLNGGKTRAMQRWKRQEVTGVVVNDRMRAPVELRREIRQVLHYVRRFGLGSHLAHINETRARYLEHMLGKINFVLTFEPRHKDAAALREILLAYMHDRTDNPGS